MAKSKPVPASTAIELQPQSEFTSAVDYFPARLSLLALRKAAVGCKACDLWRTSMQTVFGAGKRIARGASSKSTAPERKLHATPNRAEQRTCRPWLAGEVRVVRPRLLMCLGATAAHAVLGLKFRVTKDRGKAETASDDFAAELDGVGELTVMATAHPSSVLRAPSAADRERERKAFFRDIAAAGRYLRG